MQKNFNYLSFAYWQIHKSVVLYRSKVFDQRQIKLIGGINMTELQQAYTLAKAAYDAAFKAEDWDLVDKLEDPYLDLEFELVEWLKEEAAKTGKITKEELNFTHEKGGLSVHERMVDMALRYTA